jgi:hypothetical protein
VSVCALDLFKKADTSTNSALSGRISLLPRYVCLVSLNSDADCEAALRHVRHPHFCTVRARLDSPQHSAHIDVSPSRRRAELFLALRLSRCLSVFDGLAFGAEWRSLCLDPFVYFSCIKHLNRNTFTLLLLLVLFRQWRGRESDPNASIRSPKGLPDLTRPRHACDNL